MSQSPFGVQFITHKCEAVLRNKMLENVVATRVVQGIGHGCDEEACRVVRLLKFEVEKNRGVHVLFHQKAKIQFKKPAPKPAPLPAPAPFQVAYTVTPTPNSSDTEAPASTSTTYSYTIQL